MAPFFGRKLPVQYLLVGPREAEGEPRNADSSWSPDLTPARFASLGRAGGPPLHLPCLFPGTACVFGHDREI